MQLQSYNSQGMCCRHCACTATVSQVCPAPSVLFCSFKVFMASFPLNNGQNSYILSPHLELPVLLNHIHCHPTANSVSNTLDNCCVSILQSSAGPTWMASNKRCIAATAL